MRRSGPPRQAPEMPVGLEWLNTDQPLSLSRLRGKIILLDFWTYGCINSMHLLPDLKRLQATYRDSLVVIGVHSARFDTEADLRNLRKAILRHEIEHPVVNDADLKIWHQYAVDSWPTTFLIDPFGRIADRRSGERVHDAYSRMIAGMIQQYGPTGHIDDTSVKMGREREMAAHGLLSFPAKVLAEERARMLFIADTNNNRIVICSLEGEVIDIAGSGVGGLADGSFGESRFLCPHGMALDGSVLYVADTGNHCIRRLDLRRREVETVAGTGQQAPIFAEGGEGTGDPMNSPWDLTLVDDWLYIAMAGPHQIWRMRLRSHRFELWAGGGREDLTDGRRLSACLAQPSGITSDGRRIYSADSQASAIRAALLPPSSQVGTCIGAGLFDYGDRDGPGHQALLRHPRGVAYYRGCIYIADTFNNKIKRLSPGNGRIETLFGTGEPGLSDGESAQFHEPGGVGCADGLIFIADTNNHAIRVSDLQGGPVRTLRLHPAAELAPSTLRAGPFRPRRLPEQRIGIGRTYLQISVDCGPDYVTDRETAAWASVRADGEAVRLENAAGDTVVAEGQLPLRFPVETIAGSATLSVRLRFHYCPSQVQAAARFEDISLSATICADPAIEAAEIDLRYSLRDRLAGN